MDYLYIVGWNHWQTYRSDRGTPPWIKIHRQLMTSTKWASLTDSEKGQLVSVWIAAADKQGRIPADPRVVGKICMLDDSPNLKKFIELGYLSPDRRQLDATVTPERRQSDAPETETETETEEPAAQAPESMWEVGEKAGIARPVIGKACKSHTETAVANAIAAVVQKRPADPTAFFLGLLRENPTNGAKPEWSRIPYDDDDLVPFAVEHGFYKSDSTGAKTYKQIRSELRSMVTKRLDQERLT